jgi:hypothetical protein
MVTSLSTYVFIYWIAAILAIALQFSLVSTLGPAIVNYFQNKQQFQIYLKTTIISLFVFGLFYLFGHKIITSLVFLASEYRHVTIVAIISFFGLRYVKKNNYFDYLSAFGSIILLLWILVILTIIIIHLSLHFHLVNVGIHLFKYLTEELPGAFKLLPYLIVSSLGMIFILLNIINFYRIKKIITVFINDKVKASSQNSIIELIYNDDGQMLSNQAEKTLLLVKRYRFSRTIFTDELLRMQEIIFGDINERINNILNLWDIDRDAAYYLYHSKWHYKIKGLRVYAQLENKSEIEYISTLMENKNKVLQIEAQIALARLSDNEHPLEYLKDLHEKMTLWEQVNLIHYFTRFNKSVGDISSLLSTTNASVTFFGLRCAAIFNQYEHYNQIIKLTQHEDVLIQDTAYDTLAQYQEPASAQYILNRYKSELPLSTRVSMIKALGHIGNIVALPFLKDLLLFEVEYQLSIELFKTIVQIQPVKYEKCESVGDMKILLIAEYINESKF